MIQRPKVAEGVAFVFTIFIVVAWNVVILAVPERQKMVCADGSTCFSDRFIIVTASGVSALPVKTSSGKYAYTGLLSLDKLCSANQVTKIEKWYPYPIQHEQLRHRIERMYIVYIESGADIAMAVASFGRDFNIEAAELYRIPKPFFTPNDPQRGNQWFLSKIQAFSAWDAIHGDSTAYSIIGIVDSGINWIHPDLARNIWINAPEDLNHNGVLDAGDINYFDDDGDGFIDDVIGWDFGSGDNNPQEDTVLHGTHVAGCASEATNNAIGGAGIGWSARLMAVKGADAHGDLVAVWQAMIYAGDRGAHIINCSWGAQSESSTIEQGHLDDLYSIGVLIVAAAGNQTDEWIPPYVDYPAAYNHVLAVAATNSADQKSPFSNYGTWVDVSAPGSSIYSTWMNNTYLIADGTSMSAPIVAGLAALLKAVNHSLTADQIENFIKTNAVNIDALNPGYAGQIGTGRINAFASLNSFAYLAGDVNNNGAVDIGDVVYLVRYFKLIGPPPAPPIWRADVNGDCRLLGGDVTYLVRYFKGGNAPIKTYCE